MSHWSEWSTLHHWDNKDVVSWHCIWSIFQECWVYCNNENYMKYISAMKSIWSILEQWEIYCNNGKYIATLEIILSILQQWKVYSNNGNYKVYRNNGKYIATASRAMKQQEAKSFVWREHHMLLSGRVWWWWRYKNYHFDKHDDILGEELQMRFQAVLCLLGLRQIQFKIWRNIFHNVHKYVLQFDEIHFTVL